MSKIYFRFGVIISVVGLTLSLLLFQNAGEVQPIPFQVQMPSEISSQTKTILLSKMLQDLKSQVPGLNVTSMDLHIKNGQIVVIDQSLKVGTLTIDAGGELHCPQNLDEIILSAMTITVNGLFQCGAPAKPYVGQLYLSLRHANAVSIPSDDDFANGNIHVPVSYRGFLVNSPGVVRFYGGTERVNWVPLAKTVNAGESSFEVEAIGGWRVGDLIALAPTSYSPYESESAEIKKIDLISAEGVTPRRFRITLDIPLKFRHWGELQKLPQATILDERAEVANLSRHIVIMPDESVSLITNYVGGHMMVMKGAQAFLDGVEFFHMGQMGVKARYPFHWHLAGDVSGQFIKNSSIHHSLQRCITVHGTQFAKVLNNICFDHYGHGIFLEDGNEENNVISGNLAILARKPLKNRHLLQSDIDMSQFQRFAGGTSFWISNPNNTVTNNIATGYVGTGFWMAFARGLLCSSGGCSDQCGFYNKTTSTMLPACNVFPSSTETKLGSFDGNTAHSGNVGITWDGAPDPLQPLQNPRNVDGLGNPLDRQTDSVHYSPQKTPIIKNLRVFKNLSTGIYTRAQTMYFQNIVFADNGWSMFFAYNTIVKDSKVVGQSLNHSSSDTEYVYGQVPGMATPSARFKRKQAGVVMYDGPFEFDNVSFINFPTTPFIYQGAGPNHLVELTAVPIDAIGGARKYSNEVRNLKFSPEPYRRVFHTGFDSNPRGLSDLVGTNSLRDVDGSLTGNAGALVVAQNSMWSDSSRCVNNSLWASDVCAPGYRTGRFFFSLKNSENQKTIPFIAYRLKDGKISYHMQTSNLELLDPNSNGTNPPRRPGQNKFGVVLDDAEYTVVFRPEDHDLVQNPNDLLRIAYVGESVEEMSPIVRLSGLGGFCQMKWAGGSDYTSQPEAVSSLAALKSATKSSYFSDGHNFFIRIKAENKFHLYSKEAYELFGPNSPQSRALQTSGPAPSASPNPNRGFTLVCSEPEPSVIGSVGEAGATKRVSGWVCDFGQKASTSVHFYVGAPAGKGGTIIGSAPANLDSELQVSARCGTSGRAYRFKWDIPLAKQESFFGKQIYVHGISLTGGTNNLINTNPVNPPTVGK